MPIKALEYFDLDPEIEVFIETSIRVSSNLSTSSSIAQQRENYDKSCRYFYYGSPPGVESTDDIVAGRHGNIPVRRYSSQNQGGPDDTQIVFIHGGGFILGSLDSHDDICAEICDAAGLDTISIDYRLSPEFYHPVHLDDVVDAYLHTWRRNSIIVGVSAGANLSAAMCHRLKTSHQKPGGQVLIYPALGGELFDLESYTTNANAPLLTTEDIRFYQDVRCKNGDTPVEDAEFYPLVAENFSGLPHSRPILIHCVTIHACMWKNSGKPAFTRSRTTNPVSPTTICVPDILVIRRPTVFAESVCPSRTWQPLFNSNILFSPTFMNLLTCIYVINRFNSTKMLFFFFFSYLQFQATDAIKSPAVQSGRQEC